MNRSDVDVEQDDLSFVDWLLEPFRQVVDIAVELLEGDDATGEGQATAGRVVAYLTLPFRLLLAFLVFVVQTWSNSRPGFAFVRAIPAITVLAGFFGGWVLSDFMFDEASKIGVNSGYYSYNRSQEPDNPEYAKLFAVKLTELAPESDEFKFQLAESEALCGNSQRAYDIMSRLAPLEAKGLGKAHFWLANFHSQNVAKLSRGQRLDDGTNPEELSADALAARTDTEKDLYIAHLKAAVPAKKVERNDEGGDEEEEEEWTGETLQAVFGMGSYYVQESKKFESGSPQWREKIELAIEQYERGMKPLRTNYQVYQLPQLLDLRMKLGQEDESLRAYDRFAGRLREVIESQPNSLPLWQVLIQSAMVVGRHEEAIELVSLGNSSSASVDTKRKLQELLVALRLEQAAQFSNIDDAGQYNQRFVRLSQASLGSPSSGLPASVGLLDFVYSAESMNEAPRKRFSKLLVGAFARRDLLPELVGHVKSPVESTLAHLLLGIAALEQGELGKCEAHWRIAKSRSTAAPIFLQRLIACIRYLVVENAADIDTLTNKSVEMFPEHLPLLLERATFNFARERYAPAAMDLEYFTKESKQGADQALGLQYLVACYRKLGETTKLTEAQAKIDEVSGTLTPDERERIQKNIAALSGQ